MEDLLVRLNFPLPKTLCRTAMLFPSACHKQTKNDLFIFFYREWKYCNGPCNSDSYCERNEKRLTLMGFCKNVHILQWYLTHNINCKTRIYRNIGLRLRFKRPNYFFSSNTRSSDYFDVITRFRFMCLLMTSK